MKKFFNTTGPCNVLDHYMIDPIARVGDFQTLLEQKAYFVIHAPRQSGKTTLLEVLAKRLTREGKYCALRVSCEMGQPFGNEVGAAELAVLERMKRGAQNHLPPELCPQIPWPAAPEGTQLFAALSAWSQSCPRPLVIFFDGSNTWLRVKLNLVPDLTDSKCLKKTIIPLHFRKFQFAKFLDSFFIKN